MQTSLIQNAHGDLVTDAAYDFYGVRLATCSLDHRIKIWQLDESDGTWTAVADWKVRAHFTTSWKVSRDKVCFQAHGAAVTKLSWAHPEFGSVLASSSFDRTVKVWEEIPTESTDQPQTNGASTAADGPGTRWVERAVLADAKGTVRAVEFAPHQLGLKLVRALVVPLPAPYSPPVGRLRSPQTTICVCMNAPKCPYSRIGPWHKKQIFQRCRRRRPLVPIPMRHPPLLKLPELPPRTHRLLRTRCNSNNNSHHCSEVLAAARLMAAGRSPGVRSNTGARCLRPAAACLVL